MRMRLRVEMGIGCLFYFFFWSWIILGGYIERLDSSALKPLENFYRLNQNRIMKWTLLGRNAEADMKDDFSELFGLYRKNHDEFLENALLMWCNKVSFLFFFLFSFQIMSYFILTTVWNIATKGCFRHKWIVSDFIPCLFHLS